MAEFFFSLTYNSVTTELGSTFSNPSYEPRGWTDFESEIDRDFTTHGVTYEFTSGDLKLDFPGEGRDILESAYQSEGWDAEVTLTVERKNTPDSAKEVIYEGLANMENRDYSLDFFSVDFESSSFKKIVTNRFKTPVRLDSLIDLDGNAIPAFESRTNQWDTLRLFNNYAANYKADKSITSFESFSDNVNNEPADSVTRYFNILWEDQVQDSLRTVQVLEPTDIRSTVPPVILISTISGDLTFTATLHNRVQISVSSNQSPDPVSSSYSWELRHLDKDDVIINTYGAILDQSPGADDSENYDYGEQTHEITQQINGVNATDKFIFSVVFNADTASSTSTDADFDIDFYHDSNIRFALLKASEEVDVKYWLVHDILERILLIISGESGSFYSEFLGLQDEHGYLTDGCGAFNAITRGSLLRGIDNSMEISLMEVMDSIQAIYGTGYGFEAKYGGGYRFRVELMEHFYQDGEILDLGSPVDNKEINSYEESTFEELAINSTLIGYKTFSDNEDFENNIDDFLTEAEYQLPNKSVSGEYSKISNLITSGRLIQGTYEQTDLNTKWKYDDRNFLIALSRNQYGFVPENDENFESVNGLDDPGSAYNIRHAPVYMFLNHALYINSSLFAKQFFDLIQNVSVKVNPNFAATFSNYEDCLLGDQPRQQRSATGNIAIEDNYNGLRLWNPSEILGTYAMTNDQLNQIIDAMENNNSDSSKNLGYLTVKDNEGNYKQIYPLNIKWNPIDNIAKVRGLERADNYGT